MTIETKYALGDKVVAYIDGMSYEFAKITGYSVIYAGYTREPYTQLTSYELTVQQQSLPDRITHASEDEVANLLARLKEQKKLHPDQTPQHWLWNMRIEDLKAEEVIGKSVPWGEIEAQIDPALKGKERYDALRAKVEEGRDK